MTSETFKRMGLKDPEFAAQLGADIITVAIDKWRKKYPEDFATLKAGDRPSVLNSKAEEFIILNPTTP